VIQETLGYGRRLDAVDTLVVGPAGFDLGLEARVGLKAVHAESLGSVVVVPATAGVHCIHSDSVRARRVD
jgi:hypothetical protein